VHTALGSRNVVDVRENTLVIRIRILKSEFHIHFVPLAVQIYGIGEKRVFGFVYVPHEIGDTAVIAILTLERNVVHRNALVDQYDMYAVVQKRQFFELFGNGIEVEIDRVENEFVGQETNVRAVLVRLFPRFGQMRFDATAVNLAVLAFARFELGAVYFIILVDLDGSPGRKRVRDRRAYAVKSARILIVSAVELAARVKFGKYDLDAAYAHGRVNIHRNAASVILDARASVGVHRNRDGIAETVRHLVHGIIDDLPKDVMQSLNARRTYVHTGTQTHRVQSFEHLYILCFVIFRQNLFPPQRSYLKYSTYFR